MLKLFEESAGETIAPGASDLARRFASVREHSVHLAKPLSIEDCAAQSMPDASPVKWHLAHTSWFFETFILERFEADFRPFDPAFRVLFNSYYEGVGERFTRARRGLLTRPAHREVLAYRENIDRRMAALLRQPDAEMAALVELGLQHEQQHQELLVTDAKHLLSHNPTDPVYGIDLDLPRAACASADWVAFPATLTEIGHKSAGFCFDNETPRHRQFTEAFSLACRLVTNAEYCAFIEDGGYDRPEFWLSEGWDWVRKNAVSHPLYWRIAGGERTRFTLMGRREIAAEEAALHVSFFEANAYANWAGARLPTEAEWERAAAETPKLPQLFDTAWQWTSSAYSPYPGFSPAAGAVGEYNGKFMVNQYVLRGASAATPLGHSRPTYRNFFPASTRWQLTGIRLAK